MIGVASLVVGGIVILWTAARSGRAEFGRAEFGRADLSKTALDPAKSQSLLSTVNDRNEQFIQHLLVKYDPDTSGGMIARRLQEKYRPGKITENFPSSPDATSYTTNKGEKLALCLAHPAKKQYQSLNTIMFVDLHELAHISTVGYGHHTDYWQNFKFLLREAVELGVYNPVDYASSPVNYCGLEIAYNPLYDTELGTP